MMSPAASRDEPLRPYPHVERPPELALRNVSNGSEQSWLSMMSVSR